MLSLFVSGLNPYIQEKVLMGDPKTFEEAYKIAQRWEHLGFYMAKASGSTAKMAMFADPFESSSAKAGKEASAKAKAAAAAVETTATLTRPSFPPPWVTKTSDMKNWAYGSAAEMNAATNVGQINAVHAVNAAQGNAG